jgi:hypothetical protein
MPPRTLNLARQAQETRREGRDELIGDLIRDRFVEGAARAKRDDVELQRLQLHAQPIRDVLKESVAKSGCPVFGHTQVNSGMRMRIV